MTATCSHTLPNGRQCPAPRDPDKRLCTFHRGRLYPTPEQHAAMTAALERVAVEGWEAIGAASVALPVEFAPGAVALSWSDAIQAPAAVSPPAPARAIPTPPTSPLEAFERRRDGVLADALLKHAGAVLADPDGDTRHARGLVAEAERLATPAGARPPAMTPERRRELLSRTHEGRAILADEDRARALVEPGR